MKTKTAKIIDYVREHPGSTASQVARAIGERRYIGGQGPPSGILCRLVWRGICRKKTGMGPRGGYGYWIVGR